MLKDASMRIFYENLFLWESPRRQKDPKNTKNFFWRKIPIFKNICQSISMYFFFFQTPRLNKSFSDRNMSKIEKSAFSYKSRSTENVVYQRFFKAIVQKTFKKTFTFTQRKLYVMIKCFTKFVSFESQELEI